MEVLHAGAGELVCCGQPMELKEEKEEDEGEEKHVPIIERKEGGVLVKVGSEPHPMEEDHYIEWIELTVGGKSCRKFLQPGDIPEVFFETEGQSDDLVAREYCNVHGMWKGS